MPHSKNGLNYDVLAESFINGNRDYVVKQTIGDARHVAGVAIALLEMAHLPSTVTRQYLKRVKEFEH